TLSLPSPLAFSLHQSPATRALHSFPTRRSSDLRSARAHPERAPRGPHRSGTASGEKTWSKSGSRFGWKWRGRRGWLGVRRERARSEEHTSELQSQSNLVCRLLLEKKKKKKNEQH